MKTNSSQRIVIALLAFVATLGSMAIHMFVPALPQAAADLNVAPGTIQLAISVYLWGVGIGQLASGPASDRIGRRYVLMGGIGLFSLGSIFAASAQNIEFFLSARFLQALGGAACLLSSRTIIAEQAGPSDTARQLAGLMTLTLLSPALSPTIGGTILALAGWRAIFWLLGILGALSWFFALRIIPDRPTCVESQANQGSSLSSLIRPIKSLRYMRLAFANAFAVSALWIYLTESSFLFVTTYRLSTFATGLCYFLVAGGSIAGTRLVGRLTVRRRALDVGLRIQVAGAVGLVAMSWLAQPGPSWTVAAMSLVAMGAAIVGPSAMADALHVKGVMPGAAASVLAAIQMMISAAITFVIASLGVHEPQITAVCILGAALLALFCAPPQFHK